MIVRRLSISSEALRDGQARPAFTAFLDAQRNVQPPYSVLLQATHSELAGNLVAALLPDAFGEIRPEVIESARRHDFGWNPSDERQLERAGNRGPKPFPDLTHEEQVSSWRESLNLAQNPPLVNVLISRHFCCLAGNDPHFVSFRDRETSRRASLEETLPFSAAELDRWEAALGFCDLLSLYLCSGAKESVSFPFAHPADPRAATAPKAILSWKNGELEFDPPVLRERSEFAASGKMYQDGHISRENTNYRWTFIH